MKKIFALLLAILLIGIIAVVIAPKKNEETSEFNIILYPLEGSTRRLYVADTPAKWTKGLMNYRRLNGIDGMIFMFPLRMQQSFWNENTYLNLTIYWIDGGKVIGTSDLPSIEKTKKALIVNSPGPVDKVVEIVK